MGAIQLYQYFSGTIDGRPIQGGSLSEARSITLTDDEITDQTFKIAAEGVVKVFDVAENEAMGGADFIWLESDLDVWVQFTVSAGVTDLYDTKELKGSGTSGTMGPALVLGSDDAQLEDGTIDLLDGTADTIDEIWIKNQSTTAVARVRLVVAT